MKIWLLGYVSLIYIIQAYGKQEQAWDLFVEAERLTRQTNFSRGSVWLKSIRPHLHMLQGDPTPLRDWAQQYEVDLDQPLLDDFYVLDYHLLALSFLEQNKPDLALRILRHLQAWAEHTRRPGLHISIYLRMARAYDQQGATNLALEILANALRLAEPQRYIRSFLDEGPQIALLLRKLHQSYQQERAAIDSCFPDYLDDLLSAIGNHSSLQSGWESTTSLVEPLSSRELEVLRLLSIGLSNAEIAESLVIGLNTVKTHLKNIYGKLGTHSRTRAIAHARTLRLL